MKDKHLYLILMESKIVNTMNCPNCQNTLTWNNDYSYEDYGCEGNGIVSVYNCQHCNVELIEVYQSLNNDNEEM